MSENDRYTLPTQAGKKLILGQLAGAASAVECASIIDRYPGPILLITPDMQSSLQLYVEIQQFSEHPVLTLPDWETLPYDSFSPHKEIISNRISALCRLPTLVRGSCILPIKTLMQRLCPPAFLHRYTLLLSKGQRLSRERLCAQLESAGYRRVDRVMEHGEFATRGLILDLYPMGREEPYRIDFFDDDISSLRILNMDTQRVFQEVPSIKLLPAHEFPTDQASIELFRRQWCERFDVRNDATHLYQKLSNGILPGGIEYWQPLFFNEPLVPLFNYLPPGTLIVNTGDLDTCARRFWNDACVRFDNHRVDPTRPRMPPKTLWLRVEGLFAELKRWPRVQLSIQKIPEKTGQHNMNYQPLPDVAIEKQSKESMEKLRRFCEQFNGPVIFLASSAGRREILSELLARVKILPKPISRIEDATEQHAYLIIGSSERGFIDATRARALICESDLLGEWVSSGQKATKGTTKTNALIFNLSELHEGQPIVHLEHGIGRYAGMTHLETGGIKGEYLILKYAGNDTLYVPVSSLHLISRYVGGADEKAPLHKLGGDTWSRARKKAAERVRDIAAELLDMSAQRAAKSGFTFHYHRDNYQLFCEGFPFEPTSDQSNAINAVLSDMCQNSAMDRLICGDVGFGKTEVAMRAAFLAVENYKQVAMLVPTTLLAQQHFENFRDRFANWPVRIEMISRFRSVGDQAKVIEHTAKGKVDILIGTHKLLNSNIKWHDLGLLIIDEEHRFGVRHKERVKAMRADVDVLTLTATPIPRTLYMAMSGIRDLSIIATPPLRRRAVKTFVREYDSLVVRDAILREILRGGQVYYLYNDVDNIEKTAFYLRTLVPEARIAIGHGQLPERDLEKVMHDFHHQRFNVLVCTTIIETGIDIANTNTIIIERADRFGLAQLHQLRGRVGRSHHQAYSYLLTPPPAALSHDARQRLEAIASLEGLGAGFTLATHDLEIRGAGELLGEDQSGQMETIGFSLYMELLESAVDALKAGIEPSLAEITNQLTEVELHMPTLLPEEYIPDVSMRLSLYKRIASASTNRIIEDLKMEMIDRFGLLPDSAHYLLAISRFRQQAQRLGIRRIEGSDTGGFIEFRETHRIDPSYLINLLTRKADCYRLDGPSRLRFMRNLADRTARIKYIDSLLEEFQQHTLNP
ncbi:transcription-repair coupling factor [secondary endosymbiont of Ctenarytaina eucalypti]|uniref:Transcription-repair-coupling factor n=1 Tax=secondary endosymbiont of Ctenarytaina eucalypti TaxID=1199245 RepID=J3TFP2_9ENTR|nr:transcription-repair coupling factor [secondary endosymbiont of Ctenarytaina eucalypti]AFP85097.1 transcription-repair coupling factor Mfd [secondary endosymbiont of Ctenarytaina eucalypti]